MREVWTAKAADIYSKAFVSTGRHDNQWDMHSRYLELSQRIDERIGKDLSETVSLIEKYNAFQQREQYRCFLKAQLLPHSKAVSKNCEPHCVANLNFKQGS